MKLRFENERKTELYFDQKYDKPGTNLLAIFDEYPECNDTEVPDFEPEEVGTVLKSLPRRKRWGLEGIGYGDYRNSTKSSKIDLLICFNVNKRFKRSSRTWKHALLRRTPEKNYEENDLSAVPDISLLPTVHKIFAKCSSMVSI